jgi:hypothetical protein
MKSLTISDNAVARKRWEISTTAHQNMNDKLFKTTEGHENFYLICIKVRFIKPAENQMSITLASNLHQRQRMISGLLTPGRGGVTRRFVAWLHLEGSGVNLRDVCGNFYLICVLRCGLKIDSTRTYTSFVLKYFI